MTQLVWCSGNTLLQVIASVIASTSRGAGTNSIEAGTVRANSQANCPPPVINTFMLKAQSGQLIFSAQHPLPPVPIVQIPLHGFTQSRGECFLRAPAQLPLYFSGVDGVADVVPGPIFHKRNQILVALHTSGLILRKLFQNGADGFYHIDIFYFVVAADIVGFSDLSV